jgi:hypothetical protein
MGDGMIKYPLLVLALFGAFIYLAYFDPPVDDADVTEAKVAVGNTVPFDTPFTDVVKRGNVVCLKANGKQFAYIIPLKRLAMEVNVSIACG